MDGAVTRTGAPAEGAVQPRGSLDKAFRHNAHSTIFISLSADERPTLTRAGKKLILAFGDAASAVDIIAHNHIRIGPAGVRSARDEGWL